MEKTQESRHILFYSLQSDKFTSFLPLDLEDEKDKNLFDFLSDPSNSNFKDQKVIQLPLEKDIYQYLLDLEVVNFETISVFDFFKKHNLEEWVL
jgi:hypothetical protein